MSPGAMASLFTPVRAARASVSRVRIRPEWRSAVTPRAEGARELLGARLAGVRQRRVGGAVADLLGVPHRISVQESAGLDASAGLDLRRAGEDRRDPETDGELAP